MSFVGEDEFFLLMDITQWTKHDLSIPEMKQLREIGIKTAYWCGPMWDEFEIDGKPDWGYFERYLERMEKAGMKCIIPLWQKQSMCYPANWYVRTKGGYQFGTFSPWNKRAQARNDKYLREVRDRYASDKVMIISGQNNGGERVLMNEPAYYDEFALADWQKGHEGEPDHTIPEGAEWLKDAYVALMYRQQKILVENPQREIWFALSRYKPLVKTISCHGCEWIDDYIEAWKTLKPKKISHINFNYFPYGDTFQPVLDEKGLYGIEEYVGAEYCEGLVAGNGRKAIKQGLKMIVGPTHPYSKHERLEAWMVKILRETNEIYRRKL